MKTKLKKLKQVLFANKKDVNILKEERETEDKISLYFIIIAFFISQFPLLIFFPHFIEKQGHIGVWLRLFSLISCVLFLWREYWLPQRFVNFGKDVVLCICFVILPAFYCFNKNFDFLRLTYFTISIAIFFYYTDFRIFFKGIIVGVLLGAIGAYGNYSDHSEAQGILKYSTVTLSFCLLGAIVFFKRLNKKSLNNMEVLAAAIAHEIRTPLARLNFNIFQVEQLNLGKKITRKMRDNLKQCNFLINLILKNIKYRKIEEMTAVSLKSVVLETVAHVKYKKKLSLQFKENCKIIADKVVLKQILENLLNNAYRAIKRQLKGKIIVTTYTDDDFAVISVSDTGKTLPGFSNKGKLTYGRRKIRGAGIGLIFCEHMMEKMGGILTRRTNDGQGMTFEIKFYIY